HPPRRLRLLPRPARPGGAAMTAPAELLQLLPRDGILCLVASPAQVAEVLRALVPAAGEAPRVLQLHRAEADAPARPELTGTEELLLSRVTRQGRTRKAVIRAANRRPGGY